MSTARFAIVSNGGSNTVRSYSINATTGALTQVSSVTAGASVGQPTFDAANSLIFVPETSNAYVFTVNSNMGLLSQIQVVPSAGLGTLVLDGNKHAFALQGATLAGFTQASDGTLTSNGTTATLGGAQTPAFDPSNRFLFVASGASSTVNMHSIQSGTPGTAIAYTAPNANAQYVKMEYSGRALYLSHGGSSSLSVASFNSVAPSLSTLQAPVSGVSNPNVVEVDPANKNAYVNNLSGSTISVFAINGDATLTALPAVSTPGAAPGRVVFHPTLPVLYSADQSASSMTVYQRATNGALTQLQTVTIGTGPVATPPTPTIDPQGKFLYVACNTTNDLYVFYINQGNGSLIQSQVITGFTGPKQVVLANYLQY